MLYDNLNSLYDETYAISLEIIRNVVKGKNISSVNIYPYIEKSRDKLLDILNTNDLHGEITSALYRLYSDINILNKYDVFKITG